MVEVVEGCTESLSLFDMNCPSLVLRLGFDISSTRGRRDTDEPASDHVAGAVADNIAKRLNWDATSLGWFAYSANSSTESSPTQLKLLLGDRQALETVRPGDSVTFELNSTGKQLTQALTEFRLQGMEVGGGVATVTYLVTCLGATWNTTYAPASVSSAYTVMAPVATIIKYTLLYWIL